MRSTISVLCVAVMLLAGCSSGAEESSTPAPTRSSTSDASRAPDAIETMVEDEDYEVVGMLPGGVDGAQAVWFGTDDEGTAYGEILVADPKADPGSMGRLGHYSQPVLMNTDGQLTRMTPVRDSGTPTQMTGADADDRWVTWLESTSGQVGAGLWTLFSYDRSTGTVRRLGSYRDQSDWKDTGLDYDARPEIVGDDVLMGVFGRSRKEVAVLTAPLDGSGPLAVSLPDATSPDVDEGGFSYLRRDGTLMYRDATTGTSRKVDGRTGQGECQQYRSGVLVTCDKTAAGTTVRIAGPGGETVHGPFAEGVTYAQIRDGWVYFVADQGTDPKAYAVDLATGTRYQVATSETDWALMGHRYAAVATGRIEGTKGGPVVKGYQLIRLR